MLLRTNNGPIKIIALKSPELISIKVTSRKTIKALYPQAKSPGLNNAAKKEYEIKVLPLKQSRNKSN